MTRRFTVIDTSGRTQYPPDALQALQGLNVHLETRPAPTNIAAWTAACREADALLVTGAHITREVMQALPKLRGVVRYGVGLDRIDLPSARELGIEVRNVRGFCIDEMADHTLSLLLALSRDLVATDRRTRTGAWKADTRKLHRLNGQTLGLVGLGDIGRAVAQRAQAFGLHLLAYDPYAAPLDDRLKVGLTSDLMDLLRQSDWVSLHCALTPQTQGLIDARALASMRSGAGLINTARGELIDEAALAEAIDQGRIAAAGLDVLSQEPPPPDHPLLGRDNVIITPHMAWYSETACQDVEVGAFRQLADMLHAQAAQR